MNKSRKPRENFFKTSDGQNIFYRAWPAAGQKTDKAFILFHRGHEHGGRLQHIVDELDMPDVPMFAWDARGHGKTEGPRGYSPSAARSVRDMDEFVKYISSKYSTPAENILIIAQSISAVYAAAWAHDYAPKIRGLILASPAFSVKLYVPFACEGISLWQKILGRHFYVSSYVKAKFLTHDAQRIKSFNEDTLISKSIASNILLGLYHLGKRVVSDARAIKIPVQMFISGSDFVVHHKPQHQFYKNLGSAVKEKYIMEGFYHDTLGEKDRKIVFDKMRNFIDLIYAAPYAGHDYKHEDIWGPSADEYRELKAALPLFSLKGIFYRCFKAGLSTLGRLSGGVNLGVKTGFNSGGTLDYVYKNKVSGRLLIGRLFDKMYLTSPGWTGIRRRKINLEDMIKKAAADLKLKNMPVRILDVAAGRGRYILDALGQTDGVDSVLLRDYNPDNVNEGLKLIKERGLENKIKFETADAFDVNATASVTPKPTLAIVSGFYEIFPSNDGVKKSLEGISRAVEKGGLLIYTAQPWHPQLELIARTLRDLESPDKLWVMRARAQGEMDALVEAAGFIKREEIIDEWGMFSVSTAEKL